MSEKGRIVSHVNATIASVFDGGTFECKAGNDAGTARHSAVIRVNGATRIRGMQNQTVIAMQTLLVPCPVSQR